jgi:hypothetical protein
VVMGLRTCTCHGFVEEKHNEIMTHSSVCRVVEVFVYAHLIRERRGVRLPNLGTKLLGVV